MILRRAYNINDCSAFGFSHSYSTLTLDMYSSGWTNLIDSCSISWEGGFYTNNMYPSEPFSGPTYLHERVW